MSAPPVGVRAWLRWEFDRRIEVTPFIKVIIVERFVKGTVLLLGGTALFIFSSNGVITSLAERVQEQLILNPGKGFFHHLWTSLVVRFGKFSVVERDAIAVGALLYGALECFEGVGLLWRRRWAEYLVLIATAAFLPLEIDEVIRHFSALKVATLLLNIAIIAYLVWRKRLFLERPGQPPIADRVVAPAAPEKGD